MLAEGDRTPSLFRPGRRCHCVQVHGICAESAAKSRQGHWKRCLPRACSFLLLSVSPIHLVWQKLESAARTNPRRPQCLARAAGQGHQKPFWYYGQLLTGGWSGGVLVAFACLGLFIAIRKRDASPYHWLAYYALVDCHYLQPDSIQDTMAGAESVAADGVIRRPGGRDALAVDRTTKFRSARSRSAFCVLAALAGVVIAHDTRQRVFLHPADETNPYAYAHTSEDILGLPTEIADLARQNGITAPRIAVIASDPWPLPWYLRHFSAGRFLAAGPASWRCGFLHHFHRSCGPVRRSDSGAFVRSSSESALACSSCCGRPQPK